MKGAAVITVLAANLTLAQPTDPALTANLEARDPSGAAGGIGGGIGGGVGGGLGGDDPDIPYSVQVSC